MDVEELIKKYKGMITNTCQCCGDFDSATWKECGCQTESRSLLAQQIVRDLETLLSQEKSLLNY